jgi:hypothetical protein
MLEKVGKSLTAKALAKIKTYDKWVHYEILDFVRGDLILNRRL